MYNYRQLPSQIGGDFFSLLANSYILDAIGCYSKTPWIKLHIARVPSILLLLYWAFKKVLQNWLLYRYTDMTGNNRPTDHGQ